MKCTLPRCNKTVPPTSSVYCCRAHGIIGQINKVVEHDAKKAGREVQLCLSSDCNRIFRKQRGVDKCYACRTNKGGTCKREGCHNKISTTKNSTALYCCDECYRMQKAINKKNSPKKIQIPVLCDAKGCDNMYIKTSNAQKFCPGCRKAGGSYDHKTGKFIHNKRRNERSGETITPPGKMYHDHRATICNRNGKLCDSYSDCLEPKDGGPNKLGPVVMLYETNGNVDCYHLGNSPHRVNYGNSFGVCLENYG